MDPVPDPILTEKILGYSQELNPGPLGWQSDVLTTIPNRWSLIIILLIIIIIIIIITTIIIIIINIFLEFLKPYNLVV